MVEQLVTPYNQLSFLECLSLTLAPWSRPRFLSFFSCFPSLLRKMRDRLDFSTILAEVGSGLRSDMRASERLLLAYQSTTPEIESGHLTAAVWAGMAYRCRSKQQLNTEWLFDKLGGPNYALDPPNTINNAAHGLSKRNLSKITKFGEMEFRRHLTRVSDALRAIPSHPYRKGSTASPKARWRCILSFPAGPRHA